MASRLLLGLSLLLWVSSGLAAQVETPWLRRFGIAEGLPSRMVLALAQDRQGYLWVATDDGLARYDGVSFRVWQHRPGDPGSLPGNSVETLLVDPLDRVWVGTNGGGLGRLDPARERVQRFPEMDRQCSTPPWALGYAEGALWMGTSGSGLCRSDEAGRVTRFRADPGDPSALPSDTIYSMVSDRRGRLWIGTAAGLVRMERGRFTRIAPARLGEQAILKLTIEADDTLWIGSDQGLYRLDAQDRLSDAPWSQAGELRASAVLHDRHGGYWVGAADGLFRDGDGQLRLLAGDRGSGFLTASSGVLDLLQDHEGGLWFGLINQGLAYLPPSWQRFSSFLEADGQLLESLYMVGAAAWGDDFLIGTSQGVYRLQANGALHRLAGAEQIGKGTVRSLLALDNGRLWFGRKGRLTEYDPVSGGHRDLPVAFGSELHLLVNLLRAAPGGGFWLAVNEAGVQRRDSEGRLLDSIAVGDGRGLPEALIEQMRVAPDGRLWLASGGALRVWDGRRFNVVAGVAPGQLSDFVFVGSDTLWLARAGALERYQGDRHGLRLRQRIDASHGMPATEIGGLVVADDGAVWASTSRGLVLYTPGQSWVRIYASGDGLPSAEFVNLPLAIGGDGRALAVTASGLVLFDPQRRFSPLPDSPLVIESVSVRRNDGERPSSLSPTLPLRLQAGDRDLRITARLLSYANPARTRYRYRIEGYDQNWVEQDQTGERVLSRLPVGAYRVQVQAHAVEGGWTRPQTLALRVQPPLWLSAPALLVGCLLLALLIWAAVLLARRRLRARHALALARQQQELAENASLAKTQFLATLSHEVRTPMTGVLGMSELLLESALDSSQRSQVESIRMAGQHLLRLVNDTLDLSRVEAGRLRLDARPFALRRLLEELAQFSAPLAQARGLEVVLKLDIDAGLIVIGDATRLRQILMNLLSNAIKFTDHGHVGLAASLADNTANAPLRFVVSDTGAGIGSAQRERIFQRFEHGDGTRARSRYGGTGLGLAISHELTLAMGGRIDIDSQSGSGSRFIVELPLPWRQDAGGERGTANTGPRASVEIATRVLLVEDDATVAKVIVALLSARGLIVRHVGHALAALTELSQTRFDVALLDLDLPALDGFALAVQVRALGHRLPLIAVTARADDEAEPRARAAGCVGFVRKPVSAETLLTAIACALTMPPTEAQGERQ